MSRIAQLERHADATAVITPDGEQLSYQELAERADRFAAAFPTPRGVGLIRCRNTVATLVAYLAALRHGQVAVLVDHKLDDDAFAQLTERYQAEWQVDADGQLHASGLSGDAPDARAAVLLSTSGSTGSPKQVVLSADNLDANAAAIVDYLGITADERPVTTLPFHYSYGLSVINSHLLAGATLLLTEQTLMDKAFWAFCKDQGATSLAGVPTLYQMLQRLHLERMELPALRTLTQAGGRLAPEQVKHFAKLAADKGWRFFVMYGQTEATARMAYLPTEQLKAHPDCIGIPIPGGEFRLEDRDGNPIDTTDTQGELIYRGPNVMQGYAESRDDLAELQPPTELRTGDLAVRNADGLYRITGRLKRIIKLHGHRVALDEVEHWLRDAGHEVICGGDDHRLVVAYHPAEDGPALQAAVAERLRAPVSSIACVALDVWPTTASGKIAYHKLAELV